MGSPHSHRPPRTDDAACPFGWFPLSVVAQHIPSHRPPPPLPCPHPHYHDEQAQKQVNNLMELPSQSSGYDKVKAQSLNIHRRPPITCRPLTSPSFRPGFSCLPRAAPLYGHRTDLLSHHPNTIHQSADRL